MLDRLRVSWLSTVMILVCASTVVSQDVASELERARALVPTSPLQALEILEGMTEAGVSDAQRQELLHLSERIDELLAAGATRNLELRRLLRRALAVETPPKPVPAIDPTDFGGEMTKAHEMRAKDPAGAAARYVAIAGEMTGRQREKAKRKAVECAIDLAAGAAEAGVTEQQASENRDAAFRQAEALQGELGDLDKALEVVDAIAASCDDGVPEHVGEGVIAWIAHEVELSNAAGTRGDSRAQRDHARNAQKAQRKLVQIDAAHEQQRRAQWICARLDEIQAQRRSLRERIAQAMRWIREAEDRDSRLSAERRDLLRRLAAEERDELHEERQFQGAAEIDRSFVEFSKNEYGTKARSNLEAEAARQERLGDAAKDAVQAAMHYAAAFANDRQRVDLGFRAAEVLLEDGKRIEAMRVIRGLLATADPGVVEKARTLESQLLSYAAQAFRDRKGAFDAMRRDGRLGEVFDEFGELLSLFDEQKLDLAWETKSESIAWEIIDDLVQRILPYHGGASEFRVPDAPGLLSTPPEAMQAFEASIGVRMLPVRVDAAGAAKIGSDPIWISAEPIHGAQVREYLAALDTSRDDHPYALVSWNHAANFTIYLTGKERAAGRLPDGYSYSLQSEAEWDHIVEENGVPALQGEWDFWEHCLAPTIGDRAPIRSLRDGSSRKASRTGDKKAREVVFRVVLVRRPEMEPTYPLTDR